MLTTQRPAWPMAQAVGQDLLPIEICDRSGNCVRTVVPIPFALGLASGLALGLAAVAIVSIRR